MTAEETARRGGGETPATLAKQPQSLLYVQSTYEVL